MHRTEGSGGQLRNIAAFGYRRYIDWLITVFRNDFDEENKGTNVTRPTARPRHAPTAIVGKNIPAGICSVIMSVYRKRATTPRTQTIIPKVQAAVISFNAAVKSSRKMFCPAAVGLKIQFSGTQICPTINILAQTVVIALGWITFLEKVGNQLRALHPRNIAVEDNKAKRRRIYPPRKNYLWNCMRDKASDGAKQLTR